MMILALESSGPRASVALCDAAGTIRERVSERQLSHLEELIPLTDALLKDCGSTIDDITAIAVSRGPGSFTGIRIGMATAKALGFARGLPLIAVPTLESFVFNGAPEGTAVCPIFDARRDQVYGGVFRRRAGKNETLVEEGAYSIEEFRALAGAALRDGDEALWYGDGLKAYGEAALAAAPAAQRWSFAPEALRLQRASSVATLGRELLARGETVSAAEIRPVYLRQAEAERRREERLRQEAAKLLLRPARPADLPGLCAVEALCFAIPWSEESFRKDLEENPLARYLVLEGEAGILGYAGLWAVAGEGHITNVAVHPEWRGRGLGSRLVEALLARGGEEGLTAFTLEVRPSNEAALALYRKFGFREEGRRPHYYEDNGEDAVLMWKRR